MKATTSKKIELLLKKVEDMIYERSLDYKTEEEKRQMERFHSYSKLREEKVKKMGLPVYALLHELFEEENEYQKEKIEKITPQQWYQLQKEQWYFHQDSWFMRGLAKDDGKGCNRNGCVRECRFYRKRGKLTEEIKNAFRVLTLEEYAVYLGEDVVNSIMRVAEVEEYTC